MDVYKWILNRAFELENETIQFRREIHMYPELGFQEKRTAKFVSDLLGKWGYQVYTGIAETGVVGILNCGEGRVVALRADMDALPIQEENDVPYKSRVPGVMHACGHDAHVAMLLTAARILCEIKDRITGCVKLIFQPAEEVGGGASGALKMVKEGVLKNPDVEAIFGFHVWNDLDSGKIGLKEGPLLASTGRFEIEVKGVGGHGAAPHKAVDPIVVASSIVLNLQTIVSRTLDPLESGVVSACSIHSGTAFNVIPERAHILGTYRALTFEVRDLLKKRIKEIAENTAKVFNAECVVNLLDGVPPTINHPVATRMARNVLCELLGSDSVVEVKPSMGGEDFAYYLEKIPGAFLELGTRNVERGITASHHNPRFDIDESALKYGSAAYAALAYRYLTTGF